MDKAEYENIFRNEESHFYYVSLYTLVLSLLKKYTNHTKKVAILDAGCGTGKLAQLMQKYGDVQAIDFSDEAIAYAKKRGVTVTKASVTKLPFKDNSFDVVTSIDVIYHKGVVDDVEALAEMRRVLKPGGTLILRVQAMPWLRLAHDRHVHGARRYTKDGLQKKLVRAGFAIEKLSYIHMVLLPPAIIAHVMQKLFPQNENESSIKTTNSFINIIGKILLIWEVSVIQYISLPFGLGVIVVAQKN